MPIRWRLTLFIALAIGAILLVLGLALFFLLRDALISNVEDTARSRALKAARSIQAGEKLRGDDVEELTLDGVFVIVRDGDGRILNETVNLETQDESQDTVWRRALSAGEATSGTVQLSRQAPDYVYAVPVESPGGSTRVVEAGKSYEPTQEAISSLEVVLAGGIGAALLLSIGGAYLLAGAALKPVETVTSAARQMGGDDLSKRLPVTNQRDEIGRLATTINALLSRLEAAFARREEVLARQRRFAADASHELRTPLTSISGHARMLDEWALEEDPERAKRSVGAIRREAERMRDLVESLLALTRGDEGAPMDVGRYDLASVAEEAAQAAQSAEGKVSVEYVRPESEVVATFDRGRILQIASILLDNAMKYTPQGGRVTVRVDERDGWAALSVSDTGVGIPEDQLPLVFERFYRADLSRADEGAGLGLSIARQIAESHSGEIRVMSTPGKGSTFTLLLPARPRLRK